MLPIELWQIISEQTKFLSQIRLTQVCKHLYNNLKIYDFTKKCYAKKLDDDIISKHQFMKRLKVIQYNNIKITNIDHLKNLEYLKATYDCNITDAHIINLTNLTTLKIFMNPKIGNVSQLTKLKTLYLNHDSRIIRDIGGLINLTELNTECNDKLLGIDMLTNLKILYMTDNNANLNGLTNLETLHLGYNEHITNLNHLVNLKHLYLKNGNFPTVNPGIDKLTNLEFLNISHNMFINDLNSLVNLNTLIANECDNITDESIKKLVNLTRLEINYSQIKNVNHLTKLEILSMYGNDKIIEISNLERLSSLNFGGKDNKISNLELNKLTNLKILSISNDLKITDLKSLNLKELIIKHSCRIGNREIKHLIYLEKLSVNSYRGITNLNYLTNLKELVASHSCSITNSSINKLNKLKILNVDYNSNVTNINHLTNLRELCACGETCGIDNAGISQLKKLRSILSLGNKKITITDDDL